MRLVNLTMALALALGLSPLAGQKAPGSPENAPSAQPAPAARSPRTGQRWAETMNLTDEQKAKIRAIRAKHAEELKRTREAAREARRAFSQASADPDAPVETLRALHRTLGERDFDFLLAQRALHREVREILSPEQRERVAFTQGLARGEMRRGAGRAGR